MPVLGDGHCLFRSFSKAFYDVEDKHFLFRTAAVSFICGNVELQQGFDRFDCALYRATMLTFDIPVGPSGWGGNAELVGLAQFLQVNVFLITDHASFPIYEVDVGSDRAICLTYRDRSHYDLVRIAVQPESTGVVPKRLREDNSTPDAKRPDLSFVGQDHVALRQALEFHSSLLKNDVYREAASKLKGLLDGKDSSAVERVFQATQSLIPALKNIHVEDLIAMRTCHAELVCAPEKREKTPEEYKFEEDSIKGKIFVQK